MLEAAMRVNQGDLETVVGSVFTTMMGLEVCNSDEPFPGPAGLLTAAVYLSGEWAGAVCIHVSARGACSFAGHFLGIPAPNEVDDDVRDVMGELANMIAGNLKCALCPGIHVSIPSVTEGAHYSLRVCGVQVVCRAAFHSEAGPFWIVLIDTQGAT
jgi:chemotaxis protein CheX